MTCDPHERVHGAGLFVVVVPRPLLPADVHQARQRAAVHVLRVAVRLQEHLRGRPPPMAEANTNISATASSAWSSDQAPDSVVKNDNTSLFPSI